MIMNFKNYCESLKQQDPHAEFKKLIMFECDVTAATFQNWKAGKTIPNKLAKEKISELTNIPVNELFPK